MYMDLTLFNTQNRHMILSNNAAEQSIHLNINLLNTSNASKIHLSFS